MSKPTWDNHVRTDPDWTHETTSTDYQEFWCPYCKLWITDRVHRQHHHNDLDEPDERRDWRVRRRTTKEQS